MSTPGIVTGFSGPLIPGPPGPPGPQGPPGGTYTSGWWNYHLATTPPPAVGQIRTAPSPVVVGSGATIYLSLTDGDGLAYTGTSVAPGDSIRLRDSSGHVQWFEVTSYENTVPGATGYATVGATLLDSTGEIAKNARVEAALVKASERPVVVTTSRIEPVGPIMGDTWFKVQDVGTSTEEIAHVYDGTIWKPLSGA